MAPPRSSSNTEWPASASSPADCQLLHKRSFFMQGVAVGQCRQRCLQGWPFLWIGTRCFCASCHPFLQLRMHRQPSCGSDRFDQAVRVVIPAALTEGQPIPITQQGPQALR